MKKIFYLSLLAILIFSCKKENKANVKKEPTDMTTNESSVAETYLGINIIFDPVSSKTGIVRMMDFKNNKSGPFFIFNKLNNNFNNGQILKFNLDQQGDITLASNISKLDSIPNEFNSISFLNDSMATNIFGSINYLELPFIKFDGHSHRIWHNEKTLVASGGIVPNSTPSENNTSQFIMVKYIPENKEFVIRKDLFEKYKIKTDEKKFLVKRWRGTNFEKVCTIKLSEGPGIDYDNNDYE